MEFIVLDNLFLKWDSCQIFNSHRFGKLLNHMSHCTTVVNLDIKNLIHMNVCWTRCMFYYHHMILFHIMKYIHAIIGILSRWWCLKENKSESLSLKSVQMSEVRLLDEDQLLCPRIPGNEPLSRWKKKRKQIEHKELINVREES